VWGKEHASKDGINELCCVMASVVILEALFIIQRNCIVLIWFGRIIDFIDQKKYLKGFREL
jgi:hypothetical protein